MEREREQRRVLAILHCRYSSRGTVEWILIWAESITELAFTGGQYLPVSNRSRPLPTRTTLKFGTLEGLAFRFTNGLRF
jgi:hypothetical protein